MVDPNTNTPEYQKALADVKAAYPADSDEDAALNAALLSLFRSLTPSEKTLVNKICGVLQATRPNREEAACHG